MAKTKFIDRCSGTALTALAAVVALGLTVTNINAGSDKAPQQSQNQRTPQSHSMGTQGAQIQEIQSELVALGYDVGGVDGQWGQKTAKAVRAFQSDQGLEASGNPDQQTLQALGIIEDSSTPTGSSSVSPGSDLPADGGLQAQPGSSGSGSGPGDSVTGSQSDK